jgi:hypothetical protein
MNTVFFLIYALMAGFSQPIVRDTPVIQNTQSSENIAVSAGVDTLEQSVTLPGWVKFTDEEKKLSFLYPPYFFDNEKCPQMPTQILKKGDALFIAGKYRPGSDCSQSPIPFGIADLKEPFYQEGVITWAYMPEIESVQDAETYVQALYQRKDCMLSESTDYSDKHGDQVTGMFFSVPKDASVEEYMTAGCNGDRFVFHPSNQILVITPGKASGPWACLGQGCSDPLDPDWEYRVWDSIKFGN